MKFVLKILFCLLLHINVVQAQEAKIPIQEQKVVRKVIEILKYSHGLGQDQIWPGYDLTKTPIIVTFNNGHVFVFNHKSSNTAFQSMAFDEINVLYSPSDLWGTKQYSFNPNFSFEGQTAYLFNLEQALIHDQKPLHILIHERFHQYEFDRLNPPELFGNYQDHLNPVNLALAKLEEMTLADFMKADSQPFLQLDYLRDFIAINSMRRIFIRTASIAWEDHQQVMEGLADYVGYKMMDVLHLTTDFDGYKELANNLKKEYEERAYSDHAIKWRHYTLGASLGYILDFLKIPGWKIQIEQGGSSLQQILNDSIFMSSEEMENRFEKVKIFYGWDLILETISKETQAFEQEIESLNNSYEKLNGVVLSIANPGTGLSGSGTNERMFYLQDGSILSLKDSLKAADEDNLWLLQLKDIPYLYKRTTGAMEFKVDPKAEIVIDQQKYLLTDLILTAQKKTFHYVSIKGSNIDFISSDLEGILKVDKAGKMFIFYPY